MSALDNVTDIFRSRTQEVLGRVRTLLFGVNNEKLDFMMDSFYKLSPPQRSALLAVIVAALVGFVVAAVVLYGVRVGELNQELNSSFSAYHEIKDFRSNFKIEDDRYNKLVRQVLGRVQSVNIKTFSAKIADDLGIKMEPGNPKNVPLPPENPLSEKFQEVKLELILRKVSIPRLLKYMIEMEKARYFIRVDSIKISRIFGTKLYFNANIVIRGYGPV